mgnify:CR=1 FL=1
MVRISDIQNNIVLWDTVPYCEIAESDIGTYLLQTNDILFARTGGTVGKSYLDQNQIQPMAMPSIFEIFHGKRIVLEPAAQWHYSNSATKL